jgi:hypothetical protein
MDNDSLEKALLSDEFFRFGFVRNPYVRLLSAYLDKIQRDKPQKKLALRSLGMDETDLSQALSFGQFVQAVEQQTPKEMDNHWRVQAAQLFDGKMKMHFTGKLENFDADIVEVDRRWFNGSLAEQVQSVVWHKTGAQKQIENYYDADLAARVFEIYRRDFEAFGYSSELPIKVV